MPALVYVVDDEVIITTTLAAILNHSGFEAVSFNDPLEVLLAAESRCPDVLISDVMMPQLNGVDLAVQFMAIHPECKVLLFSGRTTTLNMTNDSNSVGHKLSLMTKPVHPVDLINAVRGMLA